MPDSTTLPCLLVIEDEPGIRENLVMLLEVSGYRVLEAADGTAGLEAARRHHPDLVLCDIMMPGQDGLSILRALRKDPKTAMIPFIFITARSERNDLRAGMAAGADDYITKPFANQEVLESVAARLAKRARVEARHERMLDELRVGIAQALPHELRTPLAAIRGFSDVLYEDLGELEPEMAREMITEISGAARRLERTVERYGFFVHLMSRASREGTGASLLRSVTTYADGVIRQSAMNRAREHARLGDLLLELDGPPAAARDSYLERAVAELVDNALKFSAPGTQVYIRSAREGEEFVLEVGDAGRGFDVDDLGRAGAFVQFGRDLHEQQGTGLGLAIARSVAELSGGRLEIVSTPGTGTVATLGLPIGRADASSGSGSNIFSESAISG